MPVFKGGALDQVNGSPEQAAINQIKDKHSFIRYPFGTEQ